MSDRDDFGAFMIGFIIGGLTGAAVSLLLAPQSGAETREVIREKAIELGNQASETVDQAYARAEAAAKDARERAEEWAKIARERADELQKRGKVVLEEQRTRLGGVIDTAMKGKKGEPPAAEITSSEPAEI